MRTKRFLSLLLAIAMLAAMTISVSAAETSKVYLTDDFEEEVYKSSNAYKVAGGLGTFNDAGKFTWKGFDLDGDPETAGNLQNEGRVNGTSGAYWHKTSTYAAASAVSPDRFREVGVTHYMTSWNSAGIGGYGTNSLGHNALSTSVGSASTLKSSFTCYYRILPERWEAEADEALVFTAEIEPTQTANTVAGTPNVAALGRLYSLQASTVVEGVATNIQTPGVGVSLTKTTADGNTTWTAKFGGKEVIDNEVYNFSTVLSYKDATTLSRQNYVDGVALGTAADVVANAVEGYDFVADRTFGYNASKAKLYSLSTAAGAFNVTRTGSGLVPVDTLSMPVKFSQPVDAATYDADAVTITGVKGDETVTLVNGTDFKVSDVTEVIEGNEIYSTAVITFNEELAEAADYTVTFPAAIKNTAAIALDGYNTIAFSTPTPDIVIDSFDVVKGFATEAEEVVADFTADGTLQGAKLALRNTTEAAKNVAVIYAVYASNGQLTDVVYANDTVAALSDTEIGTGLKLDNVGTVKAFVWDGMSSLKPHSGATVKTIAE